MIWRLTNCAAIFGRGRVWCHNPPPPPPLPPPTPLLSPYAPFSTLILPSSQVSTRSRKGRTRVTHSRTWRGQLIENSPNSCLKWPPSDQGTSQTCTPAGISRNCPRVTCLSERAVQTGVTWPTGRDTRWRMILLPVTDRRALSFIRSAWSAALKDNCYTAKSYGGPATSTGRRNLNPNVSVLIRWYRKLGRTCSVLTGGSFSDTKVVGWERFI